jgi:beta-barrel assembly-enhancing protease
MSFLKNFIRSSWAPRRTRAIVTSVAAALAIVTMAALNMGGCATSSGGDGGGGGGGGPGLGNVLGTVGQVAGGGRFGGLARAGGEAAGDVVTAASISPQDELAIGQSVAVKLTTRDGVSPDERLNEYVLMVAQTLADSSPGDLQPVAGVLTNDQIVNAYSGPAGYIMITHGALLRMEDESELAGVLAHEMGHVLRQHGLKAIQASANTGALAKLGSAAISQQTRINLVGDISTSFIKEVVDKGYSRDQENEADEVAVRLAAAAGYDPNGYIRYLQRLQGQGQGNLFSTHPGAADRVQNLSSLIQREGLGHGQANRERFQATVLAGRHATGASGQAGAPRQ